MILEIAQRHIVQRLREWRSTARCNLAQDGFEFDEDLLPFDKTTASPAFAVQEIGVMIPANAARSSTPAQRSWSSR